MNEWLDTTTLPAWVVLIVAILAILALALCWSRPK